MFYLHIGTGKFKETFPISEISPTIKSINDYAQSEIASKSLFEDLLSDQSGAPCWYLQLLMETKGDRVAEKNGYHSKKAKKIEADSMLQNIAKEHGSIHVQIVFDETRFEEWEQEQKQGKIPMVKIVGCKEDSKCLRIEIDYQKKTIYQACYKVYETREAATTTTSDKDKEKSAKNNEWNGIENENNEILLSNLWQFKNYTIEIAMKNKYSNVYGPCECQSGLQITSHKIMFDGDLDGVGLDETQEFERYDHEFLYKWCKTQLTSNDLFDDLRQMKYGNITQDWVLSMIEGLSNLNGDVLLWATKDESNNQIIHNLLKTSKGKKYQENMKTDENQGAFSIHLCLSILSRLRILGFKQETKLGFVPSNNYGIHFWCFFNGVPGADIYIRCCEIVSSLVVFSFLFLFSACFC